MDFDDLLYILFLVGSIVYGIIKRNKENARKREAREKETYEYEEYEQERPSYSTPEDILREIEAQFKEPEPAQPAPTVQKEISQPAEKKEPIKQMYQAKQEDQSSLRNLGDDFGENEAFSLEPKMERKSRVLEQFNLRDAIIYETILNRPQF